MSNTDKIATLQALLDRVKKNAALPRVNGAAPPVVMANQAAADVDDLMDLSSDEEEVTALGAEQPVVDAPRPRMETFAGEDIFDDDDIVELDEDDGIEILEDITDEDDDDSVDVEIAVSPEPPAVDVVEPSPEPVAAEPVAAEPVAAAAAPELEVSVSPEPPAVELTVDEPAFAAAPVEETVLDAPVEEREAELEVVEDEPPAELTPSPAPEVSSVSAQKPPIDAFDDLDFDDEPEADVSSVQPAVRREEERSSVQAAANREDDIEFDLVEPAAEAAPISSPRPKPAESMDEALQSAAEHAPPLTPPPESGQQPASQGEGMDQSALEAALVQDSAASHEIPAADAEISSGDDIDDLLEADVPGPKVRQARPEMPTLEQLGQTVELEPSMGGADLELDPTASKEVQESQGPRVRFTPPPPTEELEMALPSRPSGAFDINLKPPPEVGQELAELRRKEAEREERHSAPVHEAVSPPGDVEVTEAEVAEPLPAAMRAAVSASTSPEVLARKDVVPSDSIVERKDTLPSPRSATFADWLSASLSLD